MIIAFFYRWKVVYFRSQLSMCLIADAKCDVRVRRGWVFEDSFAAIMRLRPEDLRKRLMVKFEGEDALDYGGVSREWFLLLSHEMFNLSYGLLSIRRTTTILCRSILLRE